MLTLDNRGVDDAKEIIFEAHLPWMVEVGRPEPSRTGPCHSISKKLHERKVASVHENLVNRRGWEGRPGAALFHDEVDGALLTP